MQESLKQIEIRVSIIGFKILFISLRLHVVTIEVGYFYKNINIFLNTNEKQNAFVL